MKYLTYILMALILVSCGRDAEEKARREAEEKAREDSIKALIEAARLEGEEKARIELKKQQLVDEEKAKLEREERAISNKLDTEQLNAEEIKALQDKKKQWAEEKDASAMIIRRVIIEKLPMTKINGAGWDANDGPDMFFKLIRTGKNKEDVIYKSPVKDNISPALFPVIWNERIEINLDKADLNDNFILKVFDHDLAQPQEELMASVKFNIRSFIHKTDGPDRERIRLNYYDREARPMDEKRELSVRLELEWE